MLKEFICWTKTFGKHDPINLREGDYYCFGCEKYLYTDYDQVASRKEMRNSALLWCREKQK